VKKGHNAVVRRLGDNTVEGGGGSGAPPTKAMSGAALGGYGGPP
jgi:hypothetical protein